MKLLPFKTSRSTDSNLYLLSKENKTFLVKCYNGKMAYERKRLEFQMLQVWRNSGYPVPACHDITVSHITGPYLVMDYIKGVNLGEYLKDPKIQREKKLSKIAEIFRNNFDRHSKSLESKDLNLVHSDPNTDNILIPSEGFFYIDFEHYSKNLPLFDMVCKEIATFCRRAVRDIGPDCVDDVVRNMIGEYKKNDKLLWRIIELTAGRPFQLIHRFRDSRKKKASPGEITKYDIADALKRML